MTKDRTEEDRIHMSRNILGGERSAHGEITIPKPDRKWRERDGVIQFSVTQDDTTGYGLINRLEGKGFHLSDHAKRVLRFSNFIKPRKNGGKNGGPYKIAVLRGALFTDNDRVTEKIRAEAHRRGLVTPKAEVVGLICEKFTDKELEDMGLQWIAVMHEPIKDPDGDPSPLYTGRSDGGDRWISSYYGHPSIGWCRDVGFAFEVS